MNISDRTYTTLDGSVPAPLREYAAEAPTGVAEQILEALGESPEAFRGALVMLDSVMGLMSASVRFGLTSEQIGMAMFALLHGLEHSPQLEMAVDLLER